MEKSKFVPRPSRTIAPINMLNIVKYEHITYQIVQNCMQIPKIYVLGIFLTNGMIYRSWKSGREWKSDKLSQTEMWLTMGSMLIHCLFFSHSCVGYEGNHFCTSRFLQNSLIPTMKLFMVICVMHANASKWRKNGNFFPIKSSKNDQNLTKTCSIVLISSVFRFKTIPDNILHPLVDVKCRSTAITKQILSDVHTVLSAKLC